MPFGVKKLLESKSRLKVSFPEGEINLVYESGKYTSEYLDSQKDKSVGAMLADLITEWDLVDDEQTPPEPYPITEEAIRKLPLNFQTTLLRALTQDQRPNQEKSEEQENSW